jgi:cytochrome c1
MGNDEMQLGVNQGMEVWTRYGFTGFFVFIFLCLFFYHIYATRRSEREYVVLVNRVATALEQATTAADAKTKAVDELKATVDQSARQMMEFLQYLRGRDGKTESGG